MTSHIDLYLTTAENGKTVGLTEVLAKRLDKLVQAIEKTNIRLRDLERAQTSVATAITQQTKTQCSSLANIETELSMIKFYSEKDHQRREKKDERRNILTSVFSNKNKVGKKK